MQDHRIEELFHEAMDLLPEHREAFLRRACAGDETLYSELCSLISFGAEPERLIQQAIGKLVSTLEPTEGSRAGSYRLLRQVGKGGMGVVYLGARDDGHFDNQVAIKFVQGGEEVLARFRQERQILARLIHPNIARLLDAGITEDGHPFMVMDYFPGQPITDYCLSRQLPLPQRLALFRKACDAVEYAHRNLVVHRDVKPSNILVNDQGEVKLLDFGIAKLLEPGLDSTSLTMTGMRFFTPDYASPEQIRGDGATTATDVYSLGAVLYETLTGNKPHALTKYTPAEIAQVVCSETVAPPALGADLDAIVLMALRKEPERRYPSVAQFSEDIGNYLENRPVHARPDSKSYRLFKFIRRNRLPVAAAAVALLSLVAGAGIAVWQAQIARREAAEAQHRFEQVRKLARTVIFDVDPKVRDLTGATDVRELLVKTALEYLDSLHAAAQSDLSLRRELATAYEQVADVQGAPGRPNLGQRKNSVASYLKATELWEKIPDKSISDRTNLAGLYLKLAEVGGPVGSLPKGAEWAKQAVAESPSPETFAVATRAFRLLGVAARNRSDRAAAIENLRIALDYAAKWQKAAPASESAIAGEGIVLVSMADAELYGNNPQAAFDATLHAERIYKKLLLARPDNATYRRSLFRAYTLRAQALGDPDVKNLGRTNDAAQALKLAMEMAAEQRKADPRSALARGDLADAEAALGAIIAKANPAQAIVHLQSALEHYAALLQASPTNLYFKTNASQIRITLGELLHRMHSPHAALEQLKTALQMQREIAGALPQQHGLRYNMMHTLTTMGGIYIDMAQLDQSAKVLDEARTIAESVRRDGSYSARLSSMASVYSMLGRLHTIKRSPEAKTWYQKSSFHLDELEKSRAVK